MILPIGKKFRCKKILGFSLKEDDIIECLQISSCRPSYIFRFENGMITALDMRIFKELLESGELILEEEVVDKKTNRR